MKLISKKRLGSSQVAGLMTQRLIRGFLARRRYKKMTSLPEAELVVNTPAVIATVESVVVIEDASYELVDFTLEDYKFYEAIVHEELTTILATHKVTDEDIYLCLDANVYKVSEVDDDNAAMV